MTAATGCIIWIGGA